MGHIYTEKQKQMKEQFCRERGAWKWNDTWETILDANPDLLGAYSALSSVPHKKAYLDAKTVGMIYVAIDGVISHLYIPGLKNHLLRGLRDLGITREEFLEVLAISSSVGASTYTDCFSLLSEVFHRNGIDIPRQLTKKQEQIKERFEEKNGYWTKEWNELLALDEEIFEKYIDYIDAAFINNALDQKTRELIYVACNIAPTQRSMDGAARHIQAALDAGATKEELLEVFELSCCISIHTITVGIPALNEALMKLKEQKEA